MVGGSDSAWFLGGKGGLIRHGRGGRFGMDNLLNQQAYQQKPALFSTAFEMVGGSDSAWITMTGLSQLVRDRRG